MSVPLATTTITVKRSDPAASDRDPWERSDAPALPSPSVVATDVPAVISVGSGRSGGPGDTETMEFDLVADPCDLRYGDTVIDQTTGVEYAVTWALTTAPDDPSDLEHTAAGLQTVTGFANL